MTTMAGELELIQSQRKRTSETSTSAKTSRVPFGDNPTALLGIPILNDKHNHHMGSVDQGNQFKAGYTLQGIHRRGGNHSLITWGIETAITNSYLLSFHSQAPKEERYTDHKFRLDLIKHCFLIGRAGRQKKEETRCCDIWDITWYPSSDSPLERRQKETDCAVCRKKVKRTPLASISGNKRGCEHRKKTSFGCRECQAPLCKEGPCRKTHHNL